MAPDRDASTDGSGDPFLWTFDCGYEDWKEKFVGMEHIYFEENGQLRLHKLHYGTLLSKTGLSMDAGLLDHLALGVMVKNAPSGTLNGQLINRSAESAVFDFTWKAADPVIRVDLSKFKEWEGNVDAVSLVLTEAVPEMEILIDWIAFSDDPGFLPGAQQSSCTPASPILSAPESVVFCNRVSMTAEFSGGMGKAVLALWDDEGDTLLRTRTVSEEQGIYFSFYDLATDKDYYWQMQISNSKGMASLPVQIFRTEDAIAENMPMHHWMTPSPFKLKENVNDHLFGQDNWKETANLVEVYKIHGAMISSQWPFQRFNMSKLVFACNKHRMRLAWESIVAGNRSGEEYAEEIMDHIEYIAEAGGKLEFFTWDGMMFRCFLNERSPDEGLEAVAEAVRIVQEVYPDFEVIPLPNLPNWTFMDIPYNASDFAGRSGVPSWDYLCDIYLEKALEKGVKTSFIQVDHPFNYYHRQSREESARRITSIQSYCEENGLEMILIVNSYINPNLQVEDVDARFKEDCLQYLVDLEEDGIAIQYIDIESWYPYPQYLVPETREYSFTNTVKDIIRAFEDSR